MNLTSSIALLVSLVLSFTAVAQTSKFETIESIAGIKLDQRLDPKYIPKNDPDARHVVDKYTVGQTILPPSPEAVFGVAYTAYLRQPSNRVLGLSAMIFSIDKDTARKDLEKYLKVAEKRWGPSQQLNDTQYGRAIKQDQVRFSIDIKQMDGGAYFVEANWFISELDFQLKRTAYGYEKIESLFGIETGTKFDASSDTIKVIGDEPLWETDNFSTYRVTPPVETPGIDDYVVIIAKRNNRIIKIAGQIEVDTLAEGQEIRDLLVDQFEPIYGPTTQVEDKKHSRVILQENSEFQIDLLELKTGKPFGVNVSISSASALRDLQK